MYVSTNIVGITFVMCDGSTSGPYGKLIGGGTIFTASPNNPIVGAQGLTGGTGIAQLQFETRDGSLSPTYGSGTGTLFRANLGQGLVGASVYADSSTLTGLSFKYRCIITLAPTSPTLNPTSRPTSPTSAPTPGNTVVLGEPAT